MMLLSSLISFKGKVSDLDTITLKTSEGAILFPFEINAGGRYVKDYWIFSISDKEMILTYPDNGAFSGWSEGTYWNFAKGE